ncbi:hypothetical protein B0A48_03152 [Cryoendolithus antarcticus]|uniref:Uncharacterized protein n=1 Tax=Cryoendolithus antarcticus TaxID=1507870 RepID=A0A1V8TMB6_9PEZI|nr:hypothetical protein B0A48_03152 [Cryoendolithus antarcticus]
MVACERQVPAPALITQLLNEAMWQIAQPLAVSPLKDVTHQETAIISILSFMAEHKPALQIDRQGYRAVIRMQLAQPKTESERKWAALKALSWPPWKEDRTAMDSEIGPEQGISRAGTTLRRMQEAGYALEGWDRVAMIYSGWDTDNTPTIQRRSRHMPLEVDSWNEAQYIWAARIECTRTAQEAWACFEAAEAARVRPTKPMLLAIVQKLHGEEQRLAVAQKPEHINPFARDMFAGDSSAVEAPPPSTHQHTFTRTPPPKMHDFYERCTKHGLHFKGLALAYLVANAKSHQVGIRYLRSAENAYAGIMQMLRASSGPDAFEVPGFLLGAYVALLAKPYTNIRINTSVNSGWLLPPSDKVQVMTLHPRSSLVRAVSLLLRSKTVNMQAYAVLLRAFGRISLTERSYILRHDVVESSAPFGAEMKVLTAYRLTHYVLDLLTSKGRDPDVPIVLHLCYATENTALACWRVLAAKQSSLPDDAKHSAAPAPLVTAETEDVLKSLLPVQYLVSHFQTLTGTEPSSSHAPVPPDSARGSTSPSELDVPSLPRLLNVPSPAVLHAYIRALGWHGAHDQIHATLQFIETYADELAEQRAKDRGGEEHWRLCIIAARVFLEREWLLDVWSEMPSPEETTPLDQFVQSATVEMIAKCKTIADKSFGGWPTDEEVEAYVRKGWDRFGAVLHQNSYDEVEVNAESDV